MQKENKNHQILITFIVQRKKQTSWNKSHRVRIKRENKIFQH